MGNTTNVSASKDNKNDETELKKLKMELQKCREYTHEIRIQYTKQKSKRIAVQYFLFLWSHLLISCFLPGGTFFQKKYQHKHIKIKNTYENEECI